MEVWLKGEDASWRFGSENPEA